jgi:ribosomal protein L37AE/L43A
MWVLWLIFFIALPGIVWSTKQLAQERTIKRRQASQSICPHCGHVGAKTYSDTYGVFTAYIITAKVFSFGLLALLMPGWGMRCTACGHKFRRGALATAANVPPQAPATPIGSRSALVAAAPITARTAPSVSSSVADELEKLAKLRQTGVLTDSEFQTQKARLLAGG